MGIMEKILETLIPIIEEDEIHNTITLIK